MDLKDLVSGKGEAREKRKALSLKISPETHKQIMDIVKRTGRNTSDVAETLLKEGLKRLEEMSTPLPSQRD